MLLNTSVHRTAPDYDTCEVLRPGDRCTPCALFGSWTEHLEQPSEGSVFPWKVKTLLVAPPRPDREKHTCEPPTPAPNTTHLSYRAQVASGTCCGENRAHVG